MPMVLLALVAAYLLGSIPAAVIASRRVAGFYRSIWEHILGRPVRVEVLSSFI